MRPSPLKRIIACSLAIVLMAPASRAIALPRPAQQDAQTAAPAAGTQSPSTAGQASQPPASQPVGTAAAPYEETSGVTASRPAGAVIAPARQRRVRSILIKIGVVVGAAAAVGIVVALSRSSPSQPH